jgi:putative ABC transport system substrate-binding protein
MWELFKRLTLGLALIAACSAILLYSDRGARKESLAERSGPVPVALVQFASVAALDDGVRGVIAALADRGYSDGGKIRLQRFNAEGDVAMANTIARTVTSGEFELIVTISTNSLQTVANANQSAHPIRHVFGVVSDPYSAGVGIDPEDHRKHPKHLAGYGCMPPSREVFELARQMNPKLKRVGLVWNPAESNSVANTKVGRSVCADLGIELIEANAENAAAVIESTQAVISRGAEAIWLSGDVTSIQAADALIATAMKSGVPVFSVLPGKVRSGTLFDFGGDYVEIGRTLGDLAADVLEGKPTADVPVENRLPTLLLLNEKIIPQLRGTWSFPPDVRKESAGVITAAGEQLPERFRTPVAK